MNELKACPFCGGEAVPIFSDRQWVVCCCWCTARSHVNQSRQAVVDSWNRRTPDIVTCAECTKYVTQECMLCSFEPDGFCSGGPDGDQFCSFGKRKELADGST